MQAIVRCGRFDTSLVRERFSTLRAHGGDNIDWSPAVETSSKDSLKPRV